MPRTARAVSITLTIVAMGLARIANAQSKDEREIRALSRQWQRYVATQSVDSIAALQAPDAMMIGSGGPITTGAKAVVNGWAEMVKLPGLTMHWTPASVDVVSPRVAIERGTYTDSYDGPNGRVSDSGNYLVVWHKVNGHWRVAIDAPVSSVPCTPTPSGDSP